MSRRVVARAVVRDAYNHAHAFGDSAAVAPFFLDRSYGPFLELLGSFRGDDREMAGPAPAAEPEPTGAPSWRARSFSYSSTSTGTASAS